MEDVQLFSVLNLEWANVSKHVIERLSRAEGVGQVDVQRLELTRRGERGGLG